MVNVLKCRHAQLAVFLLCLCPVVWAQTPALRSADTIILNARVYTVNSQQPWAEGIAIRDGKILAVGRTEAIVSYKSSTTHVIDAGGRLVLPGFTDSHIHFLEGSVTLLQVHLDDATSIAEIQKLVKAFAAQHLDSRWILGRGWTYPTFGEAALPDKKYLDEVVSDRPVYLTAFDGHTAWANSKALELAGVNRNTPDPPNGSFVRDTSGEPTGAIKEDASSVFEKVIPVLSRQEKIEALLAGMHEANRQGLTRVHCAANVGPNISDFENLDLYSALRKEGKLSLRMYVAYEVDPPQLTAENLQQVEKGREQYHDDWISAGVVKFFMDGVIESHTAAMLAPYSDDPKLIGSLFWDPEKYTQAVRELDKRGIQIFTHAIGDKAVRTALDGYEKAATANHTKDARPRIEHIETISADDIPRFGKLGVIASFQPLHAYPDDDTLKVWARNTGPERAERAWVWHSIEKSGGVLAFGSDWPVVTLNPWYGMQNALTRQTREGNPPDGFVPQERISLEDAIKGYTLGAAIAGRREKTEGSIEPGKVADLIVLSQDLFKIDPHQVAKTEVLLTMVGGKVVYKDANFASAKEKR